MMRKLLRAALAVSIVALSVAVATPAAADEAECAGSPYAEGGYVLFPVEQKYVPPPMRSHPWDCATRIADRPLDDEYSQTANEFVLMYVGITFDELVAIFQSFEDQGYAIGNEINTIDNFAGGTANAGGIGAADIAAMNPQPNYVGARFSNAQDGHNIYEFTYTDGVEFEGSSGLDPLPVLWASIILTEPFTETTGLTDPSVLSSLRTIAEAAPSPTQTGVIGASAIVLMLIVGYPGSLLNSVIAERYDQFTTAMRSRMRKNKKDPDAAADPPKPRSWVQWLVIPGLALAAVISCFIDPSFGINAMSARLLVTAFLTLLVFNFGASMLVRAIMRRRAPKIAPELRLRWGSLILLALTVLVARLLEFEPGIIFGLIVGLTFAITLSASRDAFVVIVGSAIGLAIALLSWALFSILNPLAADAPGNLPLVFSSEFFSALTLEGISGLPLALLPLLALDGAKLFGWKKWVWGASYVVGLAAFMLVLLTIPGAWGEVQGEFGRWLLLFIVFAVVAVAVWAINALVERRKKNAELPAVGA